MTSSVASTIPSPSKFRSPFPLTVQPLRWAAGSRAHPAAFRPGRRKKPAAKVGEGLFIDDDVAADMLSHDFNDLLLLKAAVRAASRP